MLRQAPAELLGDLKTVSLCPFGVIGAEIDVDKRPAVFVGDLTAQTVYIVVVATNTDCAWTINGLADNFPLFQICWNENEAP